MSTTSQDLRDSVRHITDTMNKILDDDKLFGSAKMELLRPMSIALLHSLAIQAELHKWHHTEPTAN